MMQHKREGKSTILSFIMALVLPLSAGWLGAVATQQSVSTWYQTLRKPEWNPPDWVFGPIWTVLYTLMGVASWLVWRKQAGEPRPVKKALGWYSLQLLFNSLWSIIFFGMQRVRLALADILALWSSLLITIVQFSRVRPSAAWLMLPYFLWVSFATGLNGAIWWLNRERRDT